MRNPLRKLIDRFVSFDGLPPREFQYRVGGDFHSVGQEFLGYLTDDVGLKPDGRVLDVGCGCGRIALPLTEYLSQSGSYEGFDIMAPLVRWCQRNISRNHPQFRFHLADVYNSVYHSAGRYEPRDYQFPFDSDSFDCVYLTSVFTHMLVPGLKQYLSEISRVLKPGGRTLITFFLLNDESRGLIEAGRSSQPFHHAHNSCLVVQPEAPEAAIAYPEELIRKLHQDYGLEIKGSVLYGNWCGRDVAHSYQDIVIAEKSAVRIPRPASRRAEQGTALASAVSEV